MNTLIHYAHQYWHFNFVEFFCIFSLKTRLTVFSNTLYTVCTHWNLTRTLINIIFSLIIIGLEFQNCSMKSIHVQHWCAKFWIMSVRVYSLLMLLSWWKCSESDLMMMKPNLLIWFLHSISNSALILIYWHFSFDIS